MKKIILFGLVAVVSAGSANAGFWDKMTGKKKAPATISEACDKNEISKICPETLLGGKTLLECMTENASSFSTTCQGFIKNATTEKVNAVKDTAVATKDTAVAKVDSVKDDATAKKDEAMKRASDSKQEAMAKKDAAMKKSEDAKKEAHAKKDAAKKQAHAKKDEVKSAGTEVADSAKAVGADVADTGKAIKGMF